MKKWFGKRFWIKRMSFGNRISMLVLLMGAGAAFLLTIVFGVIYHRTMLRDYRSEIQSHLRDTDTVFNSYADNTEAWVKSIYQSAGGTEARLVMEYDFSQDPSYLNYIREFMSSFGYIHSVYFLNREGEISLWSKGVGQYIKDMESGLLNAQIYGRKQSPFVWRLPHRYENRDVLTLSFYYNEIPLGMDGFVGAVIVNVDPEELCNRILSEKNTSRELFVVDEEGIVTLHSNSAWIGSDWSDREAVQQAIGGADVFDLWEEDGHFEYICMKSEVKGFYLIAKSEVTGMPILTGAFLIVPMLCLLLILVIAMLSVIMGKRLAMPITQTVEEIRQSRMDQKLAFLPEEERDELQFLQKYMTHVNRYMDSVAENDQMNRVIYNLIRNDRTVDIQPYLLEKGILREDAGYFVITAEFSCRYDVKDMEELSSIRRSIMSEMKKVLERYGSCTCYEHGLRYLLCLLSEKQNVPAAEEQLCGELRQICQKLMEENADTDIYIAVSRRLESDVSCKIEVQRNNERMAAAAIYQTSGVDRIPEEAVTDCPTDKSMEGCLQAIKASDRTAYRKAVDRMIEETRLVSYPQFINWVVDVSEKIRELKAAMNRSHVKTDRNILYDQARQIYDLDSLRQWFDWLYDDVNEKMDQIRNTSTVSVMEEAVDYIQENFGDSQLGVVMLAEQFHLSAQYFGRLFLEFVGKSVSDYILQVRMEKARNFLLTKPDLEIMEIAGRVGYHSASYFSTAFKKYYGVTPSRLRSSLNLQGSGKTE